MTTIIIGLLIGFALLIWSADRFVIGAVGLAKYLNVSPLVIGVVIIGFGTSAPELLISGVSAWQGNSGLAIGNAVGSNIANIALILGVTAFLTPVLVARKTLRREFPLLFAAMGLAWFLLSDLLLSLTDAAILLTALVIVIGYLATTSTNLEQKDDTHDCSVAMCLFWTVAGLVLLLISSNILVSSSVKLAQLFGISDLVIGLTIVAIGTSLPELAASVTGALKHHTDLAIGNVLGSNIFNTLGVISVPGFINAYSIPGEVLARDFPIMLGLTIFLLGLAYFTYRGKGMHHFSGILLLLCFIGFQITLYIQSVQH
ncbi:MAG: calcium/sodium antiporter [Gammaproteobacteria bacterium]|nr:calcium/sodium antiporter [Gammaproteobacteria bacterium]